MNKDELILIEQAKKGCQKAFEQLYNKYYKMVATTVRMYAKDPYTVDDLISTIFIKVFKKLNLFVTNDSFEKWVKTIAINTCIDYTRVVKREQILVSVDRDENTIQLKSLENIADEEIVESEKLEEIKKAYATLTDKQAEIVEMYYNEGYLYREIAQKLAIPIGTVKSELHRAKQKLKIVLTKSNNKLQ